jgi:hypothetical protein
MVGFSSSTRLSWTVATTSLVFVALVDGAGCPAAAAEPKGEVRLMEFESVLVEGEAPEELAIPGIVPDTLVVEEAVTAATPSAGVIVETTSQAADGMRVEDFSLDEMPYEASSGDWFSSGRWYGGAEALWFDRSRNFRRPIATEINTFTGAAEGGLSTNSIPYDLSGGTRLTLGEHLGRDHLDRDRNMELVFYGGLSFFQSDTLIARPGNVIISPLGPVPGFLGATAYQTKHNTIFNSLEWNYKLARRLGRDQLVMGPNGNWSRHAERAFLPALIVGTRVANCNDSFALLTGGNNRGGDYAINAQNWLWGLNIGAEMISQNEFFYWGLRGRTAPSMNFAGQQQRVAGSQPGFEVNRVDSASIFSAGVISDLSLLAGWQITPNFSVKAGYEFLWVAGVATAPRQFDLEGIRVGKIDPGGQIFFNGLSFGCEGSW